MALQVWLQLNGNLNNQGISDVTVTNNGATVSDNGKIGKCYKMDSYLYNDNFTLLSNGIFSITYWVKYDSFPTYNEYCVSLNDSTSSDYMFMLGVQTSSGLLSVNATSSGVSLTTNTWYHVGYTYDGITGKLYLNGNKIKEYTGLTCNKSATHLTINGRNGSRPMITSSYLNDVRIYDHCLSSKEIHEISKGLCLHYTLSDSYLENTTNLIGNISNLIIGSPWVSHKAPSTATYSPTQTDDGNIELLGNGSGTQTYITNSIISGVIQENITYTISIVAKIESGANFKIWFYNKDSSGTSTSSPSWGFSYTDGKPHKYTVTFTTPANTDRFYIELNNHSAELGSKLTLYKNTLQLEVKDHATPYISSSRSETTLYDCSGYGYNSTKIGTIVCSNDTPRYNSCYNMSNSGYFNISNSSYLYSLFQNKNPFTISFWIKRLETNSVNSGIFSLGSSSEDSMVHVITRSDGELAFAFYSDDFNGIWNIESNLNTWNFITLVYEDGIQKAYINGQLINSRTPTGTLTVTSGTASVGYYRGGICQDMLSDFRIYSTALSASDILELYNVSASIDDNGGFYCYEVSES